MWRVPLDKLDRTVAWMVCAPQRYGKIGRVLNRLLTLRGTDIPPSATIGAGLRLRHSGIGVVIHYQARIGNNVTIYPHVTVGRADIWNPTPDPEGGFDIEDDVILCAGAVVLGKGSEPLVIGEGTVIGANAVLTQSTGPWEIWAGNPARLIRKREH